MERRFRRFQRLFVPYFASLAWSSSSLALLIWCELWFIIPSILVRLDRLSFICMIIFSRVFLGTGNVMDKTCKATFSMLPGSAPSSRQNKKYKRKLKSNIKSIITTQKQINIPIRKSLIFWMKSLSFLLLVSKWCFFFWALSRVCFIWFFTFSVREAIVLSWVQRTWQIAYGLVLSVQLVQFYRILKHLSRYALQILIGSSQMVSDVLCIIQSCNGQAHCSIASLSSTLAVCANTTGVVRSTAYL